MLDSTICNTRSYAALRAADLDWIVGPGYSLGRVHSGEKTKTLQTQNVTDAGSQLTWEGGRAGINKNVTDTKRDRRGVTTDLLDV